MADPIADFLERLKLKGFSKHTVRAYAGDLHQAEAALGPLHQVAPDNLEAYVEGLQRKLKGASVRRKQASLREFFKYCRRARLRTDDPTERFEAVKVEDRLPIYLTDAQIAQVQAQLRDDTLAGIREAAMWSCLYCTGMRAGELVGLNVEDLDFDGRELRVIGKGNRERVLPITPQLGTRLYAWLAVHPSRRGDGPASGPLFVALNGGRGRLSYDAAAAVITGLIARAGLAGKRLTCHKVRHTFATRLINRKVAIDKIQKLLGHRRIDTTTIYAHRAMGADLVDEVARAL
jgi:site-specific recombinase XerD